VTIREFVDELKAAGVEFVESLGIIRAAELELMDSAVPRLCCPITALAQVRGVRLSGNLDAYDRKVIPELSPADRTNIILAADGRPGYKPDVRSMLLELCKPKTA
jgi:hypothetical protein